LAGATIDSWLTTDHTPFGTLPCVCVVCLCVLLYLAYQIPDESADDEESLRDGATGGSGEDCLLLRLACVRVLLRAKREPDAAAAATLAAKIHPYSAAAQVLLRCAGGAGVAGAVAVCGAGENQCEVL